MWYPATPGNLNHWANSFLVRSRDLLPSFLHSIFALANNIYVKSTLKTSLFSKYYLSTPIFHIMATVQSFLIV